MIFKCSNSDFLKEKFSELVSFNEAEDFYSQAVPGLDVENISPIFGLQLAIWQLRAEDLQKSYDLVSYQGRLAFLAWCVFNGRLEYKALQELKIFWRFLSLPACIKNTEWSGGFSRLIQLVIIARSDLGISDKLDTVKDQFQSLAWFLCSTGWKEIGLISSDIPAWQKSFFIDNVDLAKTRFAKLLHEFRPDLKKAFDLNTSAGLHNFREWILVHAIHETALVLLLEKSPSCWPVSQDYFEKKSEEKLPFGVNLIGYAFGELGIGEDIRMAAKSCLAANIPFTVINFEPGSNIRQSERYLEPWISEKPKYAFNVVCLTALEHARFYLENGASYFKGIYTIGYWPWELHYWPECWKHCFSLVDEVWASSIHIQRSVGLVLKGAKPNIYMPMSVGVSFDEKVATREWFGLPKDSVLFVFSFDGNSFIERKNPLSIVKAFISAFPIGSENVGLVIKCMRPNEENIIWKEIKEISVRDTRIFIIDEMLDKSAVMSLYKVCDCFVSLHRAEGFGRGIAEALLLGLKVITTNYSGNVDFCKVAGATLIPYTLKPLEKEEYVEAEGNFWAEPDISCASIAMQEIFAESIQRDKTKQSKDFAEDYKNLMKNLFSPESVGINYLKRLQMLKSFMFS